MFITNSPHTKFTLDKKGISTIWPTLLKLQFPPHVYVINLHWTRKESVSYLLIHCCTSSKNRSIHIPNKQTSQLGMTSDPNLLDQKIKTARPLSHTQKRAFPRNKQKHSYNETGTPRFWARKISDLSAASHDIKLAWLPRNPSRAGHRQLEVGNVGNHKPEKGDTGGSANLLVVEIVWAPPYLRILY